MPDLTQFIPLAQESIDTVRARLDTDVNAGVDPASDDFIDVVEGGFYFDLTQAAGLEISRLWDMATSEVPAVAFPAFAWGDYLDEHGETLGLDRKAATPATGTVRFTGTTGTTVATGTEVGTAVTGEDQDSIVFATTEDGDIPGGGYIDLAVEAERSGVAGNVLANQVTVLISPNGGVSAVTNQTATSGGADVESDTDYRGRILLEFAGAHGAGTVSDYERWALAYAGVGGVKVTPVWDGAGTVRVVVTDAEQNPVSDTIRFGLQDQLDPPLHLTLTTGSITLPTTPIAVDSTTGFDASGTFDLQGQTVTYSGITSGSFTGCTGGTGTFSAGARCGQDFDQGRGLAPIGAVVTVDTVTAVPVDTDATVTFDPGYSLDGAAGTIATRADITAEIANWIDSLRPGDDVVVNHVMSRIFRVLGVEDVTALTLNGGGSNISIADNEVAASDTVTLT